MRGFQHLVAGSINDGAFFLGVAAPEQKDAGLLPVRKFFYHPVSELLPAFTLVRRRLMTLDCKDTVEQQHPLGGPGLKTAMSEIFCSKTKVSLNLLIDVLQ